MPGRVTGDPDPKRTSRRIIDLGAIRRAKLAYPWCAACGAGPDVGLNGHHVLPKDKGGDDLVANIVCLCGTGTSRCHGAHHGNPYRVQISSGTARIGIGSAPLRDWPAVMYERRTAEWVNRKVGATLLGSRPDTVAYVLGKLGEVAGSDWLARTYFLELPCATG